MSCTLHTNKKSEPQAVHNPATLSGLNTPTYCTIPEFVGGEVHKSVEFTWGNSASYMHSPFHSKTKITQLIQHSWHEIFKKFDCQFWEKDNLIQGCIKKFWDWTYRV